MKKQLFPILTIVLFLGLFLFSSNFQVQAKTLTVTGSLKNVRKAKTYASLPIGKVRNRWINYRGRFYYINVSKKLHKGWINYNEERYYLNRKGQMLFGWNKISGSWYYFKSNGRLDMNIQNSQFILVKASGTKAKVYMLQQQKNGKWKQLLSANGFVGRNGIKKNKREGDGATPMGTFTISRAFGINSNP